MRIGVPKEIKDNEERVAITPVGVYVVTKAGHEVFIETEAGRRSGFADEEYRKAGAIIVKEAADVWGISDFILKINKPLPYEYGFLRPELILFTHLHLATDPELAKQLLEKEVTAFNCKITGDNDTLPRASAIAFTDSIIPYVLQIATKGIEQAIKDNHVLRKGVHTMNGYLTHKGIAEALSYSYIKVEEAMERTGSSI